MKKFIKGLLFSVCVAAGGFLVYSVWKDDTLLLGDPNRKDKPASHQPAVPNLSKEYIERRRQQIEERAAAESRETREVPANTESREEITAKEDALLADADTLENKDTV